MTKPAPIEDPVAAAALLDEPKRRQLYELAAGREEPIGRDAAAAALGMSRELAAFHLDRLVAAGLLETEYRRLGTRTGPGAGRPAKLYRRSNRDLVLSFPPRRYERVAEDFAEALEVIGSEAGARAAADVARARGREVGAAARRYAGPRPGRGRLRAALMELLERDGYEPELAAESSSICLRNCPYHALAASHRDLTCGTNLAWAEGVVTGLADPRLSAELAPAPGYCCVRFDDS